MARRERKRHVQLELGKVTRAPNKNRQFRGRMRGVGANPASPSTKKRLGRPPRGPRSSERHKVREAFRPNQPVHVIVRATGEVGSLRRPEVFAAIRDATHTAVRNAEEFHIVHFSIQRTHIHLIVEASGRLALGRGMKCFGISAAKHINRVVGIRRGARRRGTVFTDRYHAVVLGSPRQVRNTLAYVLNNWRHHGEDRNPPREPARDCQRGRAWKLDPYSTALAFDGWKERAARGFRYRVPEG